MADSLHLSCDSLYATIFMLKCDRELLKKNKTIICYESMQDAIKKLEHILFHVREQALKVEGDHDDQKDVQH